MATLSLGDSNYGLVRSLRDASIPTFTLGATPPLAGSLPHRPPHTNLSNLFVCIHVFIKLFRTSKSLGKSCSLVLVLGIAVVQAAVRAYQLE